MAKPYNYIHYIMLYLCISHWWKRAVNAGCGGGHGQEGGDGEHHPCWGRLVVQPEGHPRDADRHECWHVDGEHIVGQLKARDG